ncbi:hypothetical protein HDV00_006538 [Rhizophlyctis rosea]|nr:hypothetical protein HDV00_006538 [Rhizophlyctis rosea]
MEALADETISSFFLRLAYPAWKDLRTSSQVSRRWRRLLSPQNKSLWRNLVLTHFDFRPRSHPTYCDHPSGSRYDIELFPKPFEDHGWPDEAPDTFWVEEWKAWKLGGKSDQNDTVTEPGTFCYRHSQFDWLYQCQLANDVSAFKIDEDPYTLYADLSHLTQIHHFFLANEMFYTSETDGNIYPFIVDLPLLPGDGTGEDETVDISKRVMAAFGMHEIFHECFPDQVADRFKYFADGDAGNREYNGEPRERHLMPPERCFQFCAQAAREDLGRDDSEGEEGEDRNDWLGFEDGQLVSGRKDDEYQYDHSIHSAFIDITRLKHERKFPRGGNQELVSNAFARKFNRAFPRAVRDFLQHFAHVDPPTKRDVEIAYQLGRMFMDGWDILRWDQFSTNRDSDGDCTKFFFGRRRSGRCVGFVTFATET